MRASRPLSPLLLGVLLVLIACDGDDITSDGPDVDPFAPQADTSEGLTNVSSDLEALLEHGALEGACEAYASAPDDRRARLLCGKAMFFYESFDTPGVPEPLIHILAEGLPEVVGDGFSEFGMIRDPYSERNRPLGLVPSVPFGSVESLAFGCASCHVAQLPDGRFAVGAPNHDYDYGKQVLSLILAPSLLVPGADPDAHHPDAIAAVRPVRDALAARPEVQAELIEALIPLGTGGGTAMSREAEGHYARWHPGTMDFAIEPLPLDDGVHTISKISALWGIPSADEARAAGMSSVLLGWTGGTPSVLRFLEGFVELGGGPVDAWPAERLEPLAEYVLSLRAPASPTPPDPRAFDRGRALFTSAGCIDCHQGPRGSGLRVFDYDEIGTDEAMKRWLDPELTGEPCCGLDPSAGEYITHGIKSPRLTGSWAMSRFLHNGALASLEQLFCLDERPGVSEPAYGDAGHGMTCDGLSRDEKLDLIAFLRGI